MERKKDISLYENLWQELKHYLNVAMDVGEPQNVASNRGYPGGMAVPVHIRLLNTAPAESEHPKIVFTGISVIVKSTGGRDSILWAHQGKKEISNNPADAESLDMQQSIARPWGTEFPTTTSGEQEWGDSLFPQQSIVYSFYVPITYVPVVEFEVEANISRRHFYRFGQTLHITDDYTHTV
jgi:hypothetical protein